MVEHKPSDERRVEIIEAMIETMAQHGYAKATMSKIADSAGLTQGLIHYHFKSKQQILLGVLDELAGRQLRALELLTASGTRAAESLDLVLRAMLAPGDSANPGDVSAWVAVLAEAIRQPEIAARLAEHQLRYRELLSTLLQQGVADGDFDLKDTEAEEFAAGLLALIQGYFAVGVTTRSVVPSGSAYDVAKTMISSIKTR